MLSNNILHYFQAMSILVLLELIIITFDADYS